MPTDSASSDYESHRLLRILADRLNQHGMQTREYRHGQEVVEIAASNPRDPDKGGHVVIGFEGYLVWEYWTEFRTESDALKAADVIHVLLTEDLTARRPDDRPEAPAPRSGPCRSGFGAGRTHAPDQTQPQQARERDERQP